MPFPNKPGPVMSVQYKVLDQLIQIEGRDW